MRLSDRIAALESATKAEPGVTCACRGIRHRQEPRSPSEVIERALSPDFQRCGPELPPCDCTPFARAMNERLRELLND